MRNAEKLKRILKKGKGEKSEGVVLAEVVTTSPVTIRLSGTSISLRLEDHFIYPLQMKFEKGEYVLAWKIKGATCANKQHVILPLEEGVLIGKYTGSAYVIKANTAAGDELDGGFSIAASKVFCPFPLVPNVTNVYIVRKRFPSKSEVWAVINTW